MTETRTSIPCDGGIEVLTSRETINRYFHPQYSIDDKTGNPTGFAIDILDEVSRRAELKVHYVIFDDWPQIS